MIHPRILPRVTLITGYLLSPAVLASSIENANCVPAGQNCTANDAAPQLNEILEIDGQPYDPNDPNFGCTEGDTFDIKLQIDYTANATGSASRFDLATFVGQNGTDAIGGGAGNCSVDYLSPVSTTSLDLLSGDGPFRDLDGDACGDIQSQDKPTNENLTLFNIGCLDGNGDQTVDLSYLVAWQQNAQSACDATAIANGDTTTLLPGTRSKCEYLANFDLGIRIEQAPSLAVEKTAAPNTAQVGDTITYSVAIVNTSDATDPVTIDSLTDNLNGGGDVTLDGQGTCSLPQTIQPGDSYICQFTASYPAAGTYSDVVTASGIDDEGEAVSGQDQASVLVSTNEPLPTPALEVLKAAAPSELDEPGGTVTYSVGVQNVGNVDGLRVDALTDSLYGDVTQTGSGDNTITRTTCALLPVITLEVGEAYSCEFDVAVVGQPGPVTDTITADAVNPIDNTSLQATSAAVTVTINDLPSTIEVTKSANPDTLIPPGGDVTYTLTLANPSVDAITLEALVDDQFGNLDIVPNSNCSVPQSIAPGGSYTCNFTQSLTLAEGEEHANTVTASGTDDDGAAVEGSDGTTVTGALQTPSIAVGKTAAPITAQVGDPITYSVAIVNTSDAVDPVTIDTLTDNLNGGGDVTLDGQGTCSVPQTIQPGATYSCQFTASYSTAGTYSDVVTAAGTDDEDQAVTGQDQASVVVSTDPPPADPALEVLKAAAPSELEEPGGTVTYIVGVQNVGNVDGLRVDALTDSLYGDVTQTGSGDNAITRTTCALPVTLDVAQAYSCEFDVAVVSPPGEVKDTLTADAVNPIDNTSLQATSDEVTVTINDLPSTLHVTKSANPDTLTPPGGDVTYTLTLANPSVDAITLTTLTDDQFGDLNGVGDCSVPQSIAPGGSYACSFTRSLTLAAGEAHANTVTASGTDDDGTAVAGSDGATVTGAVPVPATAVPTLAQWGLLLLTALLSLLGLKQIRRRRV